MQDSENNEEYMPVPCWKFVYKNTRSEQLRKVYAEVAELRDAMIDGDEAHAAEEATDAITALTTLLEILGFDREARRRMQSQVNEKNRRRGYWQEGD